VRQTLIACVVLPSRGNHAMVVTPRQAARVIHPRSIDDITAPRVSGEACEEISSTGLTTVRLARGRFLPMEPSQAASTTVGSEPVRLEVMWRKQTSRAEIANYTLTKLNNYARAIGLLGD
jgi:hypothetical protein